ncbi:MAG: exonuclease SbcCD subunit D [Chloroflexi bacterium]|nr:exonuclease SbcCD subunit D [Chloroflexota bacterium]
MRFIHTADWHLGRSLYNISLIEDQAYVLNQLIDLTRDTQPALLIIAGDIYDRAIPSTDAVQLLDDTLSRLILGIGIPVLLIAGNHDNPQRLQFGARLLEKLKLHVFGALSERSFIQMYDEAGAVSFYAMPYAEPSLMREYLQNDQITNHDSGLRAWVNDLKAKPSFSSMTRPVLVGHAFVVGGEASDERPLSVGTAGTVSADCFDGFHYVALGHLHRPQSLANEKIHYSGSLLKYSFSEASHSKSVNLVEIDATGQCKVERIPFTAKRDVRYVEGTIAEILSGKVERGNLEDFVKVKLKYTGAILNAASKLREVYPNFSGIDYPTRTLETNSPLSKTDHINSDIATLFAAFYQEVTGQQLTSEQAAVFSSVVDKVRLQEREA